MLAACGKDNNTGTGTGGGGTGDAAGTKGSSKEPLPKPAKMQQSPKIDSSLPPVAERVPEPYVVPHNWVKQGKYGGQIKINVPQTTDASIGELFYSYGMLRFLNDGQVVGPGLVTKWSTNANATEWTFTMRKIKWSDGQPVTTADVMFWWNDMINYKPKEAPYTESAPDETKSSKGTLCKIKAKDEQNFTMSFDSPAPLTADRMAMWTNGYGGNGPVWIVPAHYAKKFHPKYNKSAPKDWTSSGGFWEKNVSYRRSTDVPTLLPFKMTKYQEGRQLAWERNPYCYEVTKEGDQLPYLDGLLMTQVEDPQVSKVQIGNGQVDAVWGFNGVELADYATMKGKADKADLDVYLWDSGSGTGSMFFLNYDYFDDKYRKLFREPKFRQALSLAFNRAEAKKSIYFEQGEPTTGTLSPKAIEYLINDEGKKVYGQWRDSYIGPDVAKANSLLDGLGLKKGSGGMRTMPDGSKLSIRIDRPANVVPGGQDVQKDAQLTRDWKAIGIDVKVNPVPPTSFDQVWGTGKYMAHSAWEVGDGPNHLLYPQWLVPLEPTRWAPLEGAMANAKGTPDYTSQADVDPWKRTPPRLMPEKGGPIQKLWDIYEQAKAEPDFMKRTKLVWDMIKVHMEFGPFFQGTVANYPRPVIKKKKLMNFPARDQLFLGGFMNPWIHPTPAVYDMEALYWDDPENHAT
jgi:peptide/nickel transport system substrate-binding protein